tara:strand:- start:779 stop:1300 length:522 start_codon:yes stop_codon:yes gene_type:complete
MSQKNNNYKRTYIPQEIGDALKKINRNFSSKFGKIEFIIHSKWPEIAGSYFVEYSEPKNITRIESHENEFGEKAFKNLLNVNVSPAAAIEFQHFKDKILEKINSYFGYKAIMDLRIQQNYITNNIVKKESKMNDVKINENDLDVISSSIENLNDGELKKSLFELGKIINKESK